MPEPTEALRQQILSLMNERDQLDAKIQQQGNILTENDNIGMDGCLVDIQGFPRNDIDLVAVRSARQKIICLQNDRKRLQNQIEEMIHQLHAGTRNVIQQPRLIASQQNNTNSESNDTSTPIVKVDFITTGSPAETAGLQVGDEIIKIGTIDSTNFENLLQIGALVKHMENRNINLKVQRAGNFIDLILVPKPWNGRGLLGCNIVLTNK